MSFYIVPKQGDIIAWLNNHYASEVKVLAGIGVLKTASEWAKRVALSTDFFVVDTETGEWLGEDGGRREVQELPESDEDPD